MWPALLFQWMTGFDGSPFRSRFLSFQMPTSFWIRTLLPHAYYISMSFPISAVLRGSPSSQAKPSSGPQVWAELCKAMGAVLPGPHLLSGRVCGELVQNMLFSWSFNVVLPQPCNSLYSEVQWRWLLFAYRAASSKLLQSPSGAVFPIQLLLFLSWNKLAVIAFFFAGGIGNREINYGDPGCLLSE